MVEFEFIVLPKGSYAALYFRVCYRLFRRNRSRWAWVAPLKHLVGFGE